MNKYLLPSSWPKILALTLYYGLFRWFPNSSFPLLGPLSKRLRFCCGKIIFRSCGKGVNIERGAFFGCGFGLEIGDYSGLGINCYVPSDTHIGKQVMMGPEVYILARNHRFERTDTSIQEQGFLPAKQTVIEDDVWIGRGVTMTPGRLIRKGSIIGANCLLSKDFPCYSIVGGNPARLIRSRMDCPPLVTSATERNVSERVQRLGFYHFQLLQKEVPHLDGKKIAIWGVSANLCEDGKCDTATLELVNALLKAGCHISAYSTSVELPLGKNRENTPVEYSANMYEALIDAHALLIVTDWKQFRVPSWSLMRKTMKWRIIIDGRNMYDKQELENEGFVYKRIG